MQARFVRRSDFRPTRIRGVVGQKCRTSGYHWGSVRGGLERGMGRGGEGWGGCTLSMTFSSELGQSMAKQTKRRSVSG